MKLKHRIAGTILAIVFATTSALPAATIPQLKQAPVVKAPVAPKVVSAPKVPVVPKVVSAPKVPVVPKVVSAPKIPAVKVPAVKVPTAPKVPVIKAPVVVKVPVVKTPAAPKIPVVKTITAPKIPVVAKAPAPAPVMPKAIAKSAPPATTSKITSKLVSNNNINSNVAAVSGIRQAVRTARQDNPQTAPDVGVKTDLPGLPARDVKVGGRSSGQKPGTGESTLNEDLFNVLTGKGGKTTSTGLFGDVLPKRDTPTLTDISQSRKPFDQGFASGPDVSGFNGDFLNPMSGISSGGSIGGPLGDAANKAGNGNPFGGLAGRGNSLIKDNAGDKAIKGAAVVAGAVGTGARTAAFVAEFGQLPVTAVFGGGGAGAATVASGVGAVAGAAAVGIVVGVGIDSAYTAAAGTTLGDDWATADQITGGNLGAITVAAEDAVVAVAEAIGGLFGQPDPENEGTTKVDVVAQSPVLQQQIGQSRSGKKGSQGGSADATPVEDAISSVASGLVITQQGTIAAKNNLLGNPGQHGGLREGGGTANAPVRSNGSGVVTPTNDQNMSSSGGRQDDPGDFFGNGVSPDTSRINGPTNSNDSDEDDSSSSTGSKSGGGKK